MLYVLEFWHYILNCCPVFGDHYTFDWNETTGQFSLPANSRLSATDLAALKDGSLYINVHTSANPSGELRGQLDIESDKELHGK